MYKIFLVFVFFLLSFKAQAQGFRDRIIGKQWILETQKIDTTSIVEFSIYKKEKVELNTMIWEFKPNGRIQYDYQSGEDIEACLGVDFLDLDVDQSWWKWDSQKLRLTLQAKGGYAAIDDFLIKNEYQIEFHFEGQEVTAFSLIKTKPILHKILNPEYVKP